MRLQYDPVWWEGYPWYREPMVQVVIFFFLICMAMHKMYAPMV
jgi:hypothetical protein